MVAVGIWGLTGGWFARVAWERRKKAKQRERLVRMMNQPQNRQITGMHVTLDPPRGH